MVPGGIIALNMVVVVIAGMLLGPAAGAMVGLIGTGVNGFLTPAGNPFEKAAVLPHLIMGLTAGLVGRGSNIAGALTILVGHVLNILMFLLLGLMPLSAVAASVFFVGLSFETVVDVVVILLAVPVLRRLIKPSPA
jgi:uncharacterized membrane protein